MKDDLTTIRGLVPALVLAAGLVAVLAAPLPAWSQDQTGQAHGQAQDRASRIQAKVQEVRQALDEGRSGRAVESASRLLRDKSLDPVDRAVVLKLRGAAWMGLGKPQKAVEDLTRAVALFPAYAEAYNNRGAAWLELEELVAAEEDFTRALALRPDYGLALYNRGRVRMARSRPGKAVEDFEAVLAQGPDNHLAWHQRGLARRALGDATGAESDYSRALLLAPSFAGAHVSRGVLRFSQGRMPEALEDFGSAVALAPDSVMALYNRGTVLQVMGRPGKAEADYSRVLALAPGFADAWNNRGAVRDLLGRRKEALADFGRAVLLSPGRALPYVNRGRVLLEMGRFEEAAADLGRALALAPDLPEAPGLRLSLARALSAMGKKEKALRQLDRLLDGKGPAPDTGQKSKALMARARIRYDLGLFSGAARDLGDFLDSGPGPRGRLAAQKLRGRSLFVNGDFVRAGQDFKAALAGGGSMYDALWFRACQLRLGRADEPLPSRLGQCRDDGPWPCPVALFHMGRISADDLLAAARKDKKGRDGRTCEAAFHLGQAALAAGDRVAAVRHFRTSVHTAAKSNAEYAASAAELVRLGFD